MAVFLGHDLGTSANKAVVVDADATVLAGHVERYPLRHPHRAWVEQDPEQWWKAVSACTQAAVSKAGLNAADISGIAFCGQMLSLVAVDAVGAPTRPAILWMDARAQAQADRLNRRFGGRRVLHLVAGAAPTGKDIVAKIAWLAEHEPEVVRRTAFYTDATGYLVARATDRVCIDPTAAGATGMLDVSSRTWSRSLARLAAFPLERMPPLVSCTQVVGELTSRAARDLGLRQGTPVAMGMADIPAAAVGAGAVEPGNAHVYLGTSSWIGITTKRPKRVPRCGIAAVPSADPSTCLMIGESETAGACRDWLGRCLGPPGNDASLDEMAASAEPGSRGLLFLPWMFGERSPVADTRVRGAFVNLSLDHGRRHLVRALYEGTALNLRWILDACASAGETCPSLRAIGGGAASDAWLSILADVTGRPLERVAHPVEAGAAGSALVAAVAAGSIPDVAAIGKRVRVQRRFRPNARTAPIYREAYEVFRELYGPLSRAGRLAQGET